MVHSQIPSVIFEAFSHLGTPIDVKTITMGLINKTFLVTTETSKYILQEVAPIFDTTVTEDNLAVARHLECAGIPAPMPYKTVDNGLFVQNDNRVFRALKFIDGTSSHTISSLRMAESAGRVMGEFHRAMSDFEYTYRSRRHHGGDYAFHREGLITTLMNHRDHDFYPLVAPLAKTWLASLDRITQGLTATARHVHGDPKVSNILFTDNNDAICLVDFDTLNKTGWSLEMGDALRSWCNPYPEDVLDAHVDLARANAALTGYGALMRGVFTRGEAEELVRHSQAITLCLAVRFLADVLNERYWQFDTTRFSRSSEHQWLRAQSMHNLFLDFARRQNELSEMAHSYLL